MPTVAATASSAASVARGSALIVVCNVATARITRMPTGIDTESCCTIVELRSMRSAANGTARRASVMVKTIARTATRYQVSGIDGLPRGSTGAEGLVGNQQCDEQQQCGEQGDLRCQHEPDGYAGRGEQRWCHLPAGAEPVEHGDRKACAQREFQPLDRRGLRGPYRDTD